MALKNKAQRRRKRMLRRARCNISGLNVATYVDGHSAHRRAAENHAHNPLSVAGSIRCKVAFTHATSPPASTAARISKSAKPFKNQSGSRLSENASFTDAGECQMLKFIAETYFLTSVDSNSADSHPSLCWAVSFLA